MKLLRKKWVKSLMYALALFYLTKNDHWEKDCPSLEVVIESAFSHDRSQDIFRNTFFYLLLNNCK